MIRNPITRAIAATLVVAAAMALAPAKADAADIGYGAGYGNQQVDIIVQDVSYRTHGHGGYYVGYKPYRYDRYVAPRGRRGWHGPGYRHGRWCKPRKAVKKARRMGVHRAGVSRVSKRKILVTGYRHGYHVGVVFARKSPHCRVVATY
ncbi:MAG: hypothetical protein AAF362_02305 [Pseudomonadota bacterium]